MRKIISLLLTFSPFKHLTKCQVCWCSLPWKSSEVSAQLPAQTWWHLQVCYNSHFQRLMPHMTQGTQSSRWTKTAAFLVTARSDAENKEWPGTTTIHLTGKHKVYHVQTTAIDWYLICELSARVRPGSLWSQYFICCLAVSCFPILLKLCRHRLRYLCCHTEAMENVTVIRRTTVSQYLCSNDFISTSCTGQIQGRLRIFGHTLCHWTWS